MRPRRLILKLAACLAAGAVVTVAVAWGLTCWGSVVVQSERVIRSKVGESTALRDLGPLGRLIDPRLMPPATFSKRPAALVKTAHGFGLRDQSVSIMNVAGIRSGFTGMVRVCEAGWPLLAMSSVLREDDTGRKGDRELRLSARWTPAEYAPGDILFWRPALPLRPEPRGFASNTLFYAAVFAALCFGPSVLRRHLRRRRGLCPACRYSLKGLPAGAPCPECGKPGAGVDAGP